jgi:hypothetical protein
MAVGHFVINAGRQFTIDNRLLHAWLRHGIGPQSCTYLIDLRFSYRRPAAVTPLFAVGAR